MAPTSELADQVLCDYMGASVHAFICGTYYRDDIKILKAGAHVVVGTPVVSLI